MGLASERLVTTVDIAVGSLASPRPVLTSAVRARTSPARARSPSGQLALSLKRRSALRFEGVDNLGPYSIPSEDRPSHPS